MFSSSNKRSKYDEPGPSSSKSQLKFDPVQGLVPEIESKKGKKKATKIRPVSVNVHLLSTFSTVIPKGKKRKSLETEGRMNKLSFYRVSTEQAIRKQIESAFGIQDFQVLECNNGKLEVSPTQEISAEYVIDRRGGLYLLEKHVPKVQFFTVIWYIFVCVLPIILMIKLNC